MLPSVAPAMQAVCCPAASRPAAMPSGHTPQPLTARCSGPDGRRLGASPAPAVSSLSATTQQQQQHTQASWCARRTSQARLHGGVCCSSGNGVSGREGMPEEDQSIKVKCMLAEGSGKLDLSECELAQVPPRILGLAGLEELSLAGNQLQDLPAELGSLPSLGRLQLAGNQLASVPPTLCALRALQGLWLHGNLLDSLPTELGSLSSLTQLSLSGNRLTALPDSLGGLTALQELGAAGNQLSRLPPSIGQLGALKKLSLHGNHLREVPDSVGGLTSLEELSLQGNPGLTCLPDQLGALPALRDLCAADCALASVPASLAGAPALETLTLYGNQLTHVPPELLQARQGAPAPSLKAVWLEGNPLSPGAVAALLAALPASNASALGLDEQQLGQLPPGERAALVAAAGRKLRVAGAVPGGPGVGYFKLERDPGAAGGAEVLVVSFGSAPGTPNWGGLLKKVRAAAAEPQEACFDVLYVVDPSRAWYGGGDAGYEHYEARLRAACERYRHVVFIGDSMGATAALLFAHLATEVHAWTPQVDLATSSIRPGQGREWQSVLRQRVLEGVAGCKGEVVVHTGTWRHDLDQARSLPTQPGLKVQIYSVDSHRLALALDRRGMLVQIVRSAVLHAMGLSNKEGLRLANLF